jgi:hypothetical protein
MMMTLGFFSDGFLGWVRFGRFMSRSLAMGAVEVMKMTSSTNARSSKGVMFSSFIVL